MSFKILISLIVTLAMSLIFMFGKNLALSKELSNLKDAYIDQSRDYVIVSNNLNACNTSLDLQNQAIKEASVKVDNTPSKEAERIKKIYVKDKSCEAELRAYKELFFDFADEQGPSLRPAPSAGPHTKDLSDFADKNKGKK